jgi:hypothetical protein
MYLNPNRIIANYFTAFIGRPKSHKLFGENYVR